MPHVIVQYTKEVAKLDGGFFLGSLRKRLRGPLAVFLSVEHRPLTQNDFSFMFLRARKWDSLIHGIQVIILAHADEERVKKSDELAEAIATAIEETIQFSRRPEKLTVVSFSVSLHLGEMGYFASEVMVGAQQ